MYLKSLELHGFKSFPDKIRLTFDEGMTAVVGPNGSGKSNIGDAVRWVLGEQSTKELRGKSMEDVIFSGTSTRKPVGFAAVTLTIDNSDHALSAPEDEVAVTRKLYRNGDSEYLINGKNVRLKDVNELFMDTGLGRDGYAIIGQGRIAEIVGAKSNERRDIFEEAAGVSKFRYKKQEAERKLAAAQENLLRINDIAAELEGRIEPLKVQSEKAERFLVLAEERKQLEISVWNYRLTVLSAQMQSLADRCLQLTAEYENLQSDIAREEEKLQLAYRDMQQATVDIETLQTLVVNAEQENANLIAGIAVCDNEIRHSTETMDDCREQLRALSLSASTWEQKIAEQDAYLTDLLARQEQLEAELESAAEALAKAEQQAASADTKARVQDDALSRLVLQQSEQRVRLQTAENDYRDASEQVRKAKEESISLAERLQQYASKERTLQQECGALEEKRTELLNRAEGFHRLATGKEQKYQQTVDALTELNAEYRQVQQKQRILHDLEQNMEGYAGSVRQVLKIAGGGRLGGVYGTVAQLITVEPRYGNAIETALGGALQNLVVENEDAAKRCIRYLKEIHGGRATFLPLTTIRGGVLRENLNGISGFVAIACDLVGFEERYRNVMESLLGRIAVAEDIDSATLIAKKFGYRFRIVTLDGQVIHSGGSFTGGSAARSAGVITRKHEMEEATAHLKKLEAEQQTARIEAEKAKAEWDKLRVDTEGVRALISENDEQLNEKRRLLAQLQATAEADSRMQETDAQRVERLQQRADQLLAICEEAKIRIAALDAEIATGEAQRSESRLQRSDIEQDRVACTDRISVGKVRRAELLKDIETEQHNRLVMAQSMEASEEQRQHLEERLKQAKTFVVQKEREKQTLLLTQQENRKKIDTSQEETRRLRALHEEKERYTRVLRDGIDELRDAREKQSGERSRAEERLANAQKEIDDLVFRLQETYEMTRSEAETYARPITDLRETETALTAVKNRIRALGSVNVAAIDEYREVSERYTFLSGQMKDIEQAKGELEHLIEQLTEDMCRIFRESFDLINRYFSEIFHELFGGGSASLALTDPDHILESGIEISVAPPGKVIRNLIALSGGEQSFVAICIYFAILKLRPAPFCILDEIDAALDEVNVRKYAQYLQKFIDHTQFVVITHRRSAMEEANVLYGVTMQEDGVSRLLRLDQNGMAMTES